MRDLLRWGMLSATLFLVAGVLGLNYLAYDPWYNSAGTQLAFMPDYGNVLLGGLFMAGLISLLLFGLSFHGTATLVLKGEVPETAASDQVQLVSGVR